MRATTAVLLACALALTGCTSGGEGDAARATPAPSASASAAGASPAELSEQVLSAAVAAAERPPLASQTVDSEGEQLTVDVVEVRRTRDAVLAEFRLSSANPDVNVGLNRFEEDRLGSVYFVTGVFLEDPAAGVRYRPLSYNDERRGVGCVCPVKTLVLGPEPQTVHAMFPPLPDDLNTVTFRMFEAFEIPGVEVTG